MAGLSPAFGVFDGAEFVFALGRVDQRVLGQRNGVENELFQLHGVRLGRLDQRAVGIDERHLFVGPMPDQFQIAAGGGQAVDEADPQRVDGDAAGVEGALAVGVGLLGQAFGQVAVFDHLGLTVADAEVADLFERAGLGDGLAAHLAAGEIVQAEEERVDHFYDRVVDLEIGKVLDAAGLHVVERAAVA